MGMGVCLWPRLLNRGVPALFWGLAKKSPSFSYVDVRHVCGAAAVITPGMEAVTGRRKFKLGEFAKKALGSTFVPPCTRTFPSCYIRRIPGITSRPCVRTKQHFADTSGVLCTKEGNRREGERERERERK